MIAAIFLVQAVAFAVLSGIVANNKNRNPAGWGALGFLFGLFAFIAVLVLEKVEPNEEQRSATISSQSSTTQEFDPDEHKKKCPMCAEYIKLEARRCKHCGHEVSEHEVEQKIKEVRREQKRTTTQSRRGAKRLQEKPNSPSGSKTDQWVITIAVLGGIILIILVIAIHQAG